MGGCAVLSISCAPSELTPSWLSLLVPPAPPLFGPHPWAPRALPFQLVCGSLQTLLRWAALGARGLAALISRGADSLVPSQGSKVTSDRHICCAHPGLDVRPSMSPSLVERASWKGGEAGQLYRQSQPSALGAPSQELPGRWQMCTFAASFIPSALCPSLEV